MKSEKSKTHPKRSIALGLNLIKLFMKGQKRMRDAFGDNEIGQPDLPVKISNVQIARMIVGEKSGCSRCFPHGYEVSNSTISNSQRNWKRYRKTRWREHRPSAEK